MSSSSDRDVQSKLEEMEAEINRASTFQNSTTETTSPRVEIAPSPQMKNWLNSAKTWFDALPQVGRIAVGVGAIWFGFSVLTAFLHVVSSLISIALMGFILYIGYRFISQSKS